MTKQCPICRESHEPGRGLSYDGCGINSCGMYRDRIATFTDKRGLTAGLLGPMFAEAPSLLAALEGLLDAISDLGDEARETFDEKAVEAAIAAQRKARGAT